MTDDGDESDPRDHHQYSEGQGFDDPYEGFDLDPPELEVDPDEVDPVDSRVLADLLDEHHVADDEVDIDSLIDVGLSYMGIKRFEQAVDAFERAARFAPDGSTAQQEAWVNKGVAHAEMEEWDAAASAHREALFVDEDGEFAAEAQTNLAYALWMFGEDEEAFQHAEEAVKTNERLPQAWYNLGFIEAERGLHEDAIDCLEKAEQLGFRSVELFEEKARVLEALGREEAAQEATERAESLREQREEQLVE